MAGKSNKGKKKASQSAATASEQPVPSETQVDDSSVTIPDANGNGNGNGAASEVAAVESEPKEVGDSATESQANQGDVRLYAVTVRTQGGDKMELQLSPGDSVMDVRQFLLDAPETCYFTCYDLSLHCKDGSVHHLEDFNEISEVADITTGGCYLEMVAAQYDDRSIRAHVNRTRELLSLSTLHSSLSTSLALQHENGKKSSSANPGDSSKSEVLELDNMVFLENAPGSLTSLLLPPSKEIKCVESVVFSSLNPPPSYRRLSGDLIYLDVVTLEGNAYCITGTTRTFYVNSSTADNLDPKPSKSAAEATTLVGLLQKISSKFKKAFREILGQKAAAHPFENVPSMLPPTSWIGLHPIPAHRRDAARAEDALTLTFGSELIGMQRDWNEELQSCREFPHTSLQERILRDRALYKVTSDFVDAAVKGAVGVISRCIPPINPTDPECFHMYVHNNIFFSFAVDADLEQLSKKQSSDVNGKVESAIASLAQPDKSSSNPQDGTPVLSNKSTEGNINGVMDSIPDVPTETQLAESEQATYASANNDLKGTKAYQEADIPGLYNLAMAIIDYRGHRVVAQSVLPGILQGDKSDSLLYGSVDNGKKICWSEEFHSKVVSAAKRLHLKEHAVSDGSGVVYKLAAPVECKGIVGSDDRHYLLDLMRVTPRDANYTGPASRFCILRPELITAFCHSEEAKRVKSKSKSDLEATAASDSSVGKDAELGKEDTNDAELAKEDTNDAELAKEDINDAKEDTNELETSTSDKRDVKGENAVAESASETESKDSCQEILFNPNVFTEFKLAGSPEEIAEDEENVRKASLYLNDVVLPKFIQDLCALEVSPMDGLTLTDALHAHGINIRYIGKVAEGTRQLPHLWDLVSSEIVVRSAKHALKEVLRDTEDHDVGNAISHVFNCLFGNVQNITLRSAGNSSQSNSQKKDTSHQSSGKSSKVRGKPKSTQSTRKKETLFSNISSDSLWSEIQEFAKIKYQFEFPEDARTRVKKLPVIRNLCQKVGVTIAARKYDLESETPFQISDIMDLKPVVKHSIPVSSEAKNLVETGKVQLAEGLLAEAYTLFSEAFTIFQQVTGPMHREVANCCRYLAMVLYHAGDMPAAIMQQHKELIINERCLGLDHPDTAHSYGNMALFYHGLNQTELALRHMSRALTLLNLSCGPDHPDVAATFINVAMMYQDIGKMHTALRYLQEALKKNERLLGEEHIQTAVCYHALAIAFNCMGAFKLSHQHEKKTYDILVKQLGEDDSRTRDSQNWMNTFKMRELQMNAQKQKGQALDAASAQKALEMIKAHPDLIKQFQATAAGGPSAAAANKSLNAAFMGEAAALPRGRGVDERGARAAAEVRKKAAAKGLLVRPHGPSVPDQALPQITQRILNMINSGVTPEAVNSETAGEQANGHSPSGPENATEGQTKSEQQPNQAPVGLGSGLALDPKKQKAKAKAKASS